MYSYRDDRPAVVTVNGDYGIDTYSFTIKWTTARPRCRSTCALRRTSVWLSSASVGHITNSVEFPRTKTHRTFEKTRLTYLKFEMQVCCDIYRKP